MILWPVFGIVLATNLVAGCAGPHFYDPAKADLARQGKETVDSLDFSAFMAAEDQNITVYQQEETKVWRENVQLTRDLEIARLAESSLPFEEAWLGPDAQLGKHLNEGIWSRANPHGPADSEESGRNQVP